MWPNPILAANLNDRMAIIPPITRFLELRSIQIIIIEIKRTGQWFDFVEFTRVISKGRSTWIDFFSEDDDISMVEVFGFLYEMSESHHDSKKPFLSKRNKGEVKQKLQGMKLTPIITDIFNPIIFQLFLWSLTANCFLKWHRVDFLSIDLLRSVVEYFLYSIINGFNWFNASLSNIHWQCRLDSIWKSLNPIATWFPTLKLSHLVKVGSIDELKNVLCIFVVLNFLCIQSSASNDTWFFNGEDLLGSKIELEKYLFLSLRFHIANQPLNKNRISSHLNQQRTLSLSCSCTQSKRDYISLQLSHPE